VSTNVLLEVTLLEDSQWEHYEAFVYEHPGALLYHTRKYLEMLREVTGDVLCVLLAWEGGELVGVLPTLVSPDRGSGSVLNSLPFFGSHGGILASQAHSEEVFRGLLSHLDQIIHDHKCVAATFVLTPFERNLPLYRTIWKPTCEDSRIGQIVMLPTSASHLMSQFSVKRRNNVRRSMKAGAEVIANSDPEGVRWLRQMHETGIRSKGGITKPASFFAWCQREAQVSDFCTFRFVTVGDRLAAGAILFQFREYVEYYLSAIDPDFSKFNPLVLLIHRAMCDGIEAGKRYFSFGGTWTTQVGLYRFKNQFGAQDFPYQYLVKIYNPSILSMSKTGIVEAFPFFYVVPFSQLRDDSA
jgi:hypothetical protein